jgi:precorrin-2/cobalt-factor-2 C20-methyltransferase
MTFYALGLGPGDPDLMTVRARDVLQRVPTLFAPVRQAAGRSYALDIVDDLIDPTRQRIETLAFPAVPSGWASHVDQMVSCLADGDVALLTEGDPLLYSTFIGVLAELQTRHPDVPLEVVPGVASPMAAAAAAGLPLADDNQSLAILPAMHALDMLPQTLRHFDTLVLLKVAPVLDTVLDCLERQSPAANVLHVRRVGRPEQSVLSGIERIRTAPAEIKADYFSLLIVTTGTTGAAR